MIKFSDITDLRPTVLEYSCGFKLITENDHSLVFKINGLKDIDKVYITESTKSKTGYDIIFYSKNKINNVVSKVSKGKICSKIENIAGVVLS